jgi:hypothetical protein
MITTCRGFPNQPAILLSASPFPGEDSLEIRAKRAADSASRRAVLGAGGCYLPAGISAPGDDGNTADLEDCRRELAFLEDGAHCN